MPLGGRLLLGLLALFALLGSFWTLGLSRGASGGRIVVVDQAQQVFNVETRESSGTSGPRVAGDGDQHGCSKCGVFFFLSLIFIVVFLLQQRCVGKFFCKSDGTSEAELPYLAMLPVA